MVANHDIPDLCCELVKAPEFRVGDVVMLKSGGPLMTVMSVEETVMSVEDNFITAEWWDHQKNDYTESAFYPPQLVKISG